LQSLTVTFQPGEVHAVVGENGAGKSTLMNILGGFLTPSRGTVTWGDLDVPTGSPQRCREAGIEMVHQHFMLVPEFTALENLQLSLLGLKSKTTVDDLVVKAKELDWEIDWQSKVKDLPVGAQQRLEILKTMAGSSKVIIFDEPTAVLGESEVEGLLNFIRSLARQGKIVILIAHKIEEVLSIADRITVLRKGQHIVTKPRGEVTADALVEWMVGERLSEAPTRKAKAGAVILQTDRVQVLPKAARTVSLDVRSGEILGIGGVDGNGQLELSELLSGVRKPGNGKINTKTINVGFVPQDRRVDGLALDMSLADNMLVAALPKMPRVLNPKAVFGWASNLITKFQIKAQSANDNAKQLSGGNQQKVILARVLDQSPEMIIAVNPTRGLDVKAAAFVHRQLREASDAGAAVVLFSTDRDELSAVSDHQLWMSRGQLFQTEAEALA
jgi:general nucleoside transport system ATP-binding protein